MDIVPKYPRTYHWPWSPQVHQDDSYHRDPTVFVGPEVVITEKLDGGNTCLARGDVFARSTGQRATAGWFAMVRKHHAYKTVGFPEDLYTYGEDLFGIHSIAYDPISESGTYFVFGARRADVWYSWSDLVIHAADMGLRTVPLLFRGAFKSVDEITAWMHARIKQPSTIGPQTEGFVIRFADSFHNSEFQTKVAKYVRKDHVQTDEHWTKNWKPATLLRE